MTNAKWKMTTGKVPPLPISPTPLLLPLLPHCFLRARQIIAALCLLFCCVAYVPAQYRFDSWTTDNGLPQNGVRGITQTPDGYLWFTTFDGLVRFDGAKFTVFDKNNSKGISNNRFFDLHLEPDGSFLAVAEDAILTRYRDGNFKSFQPPVDPSGGVIFALTTDVHGESYVATRSGNYYLRGDHFVPVAAADIPNEGHFYRSPNHGLWLYDLNGVSYISADKHETRYNIKFDIDPHLKGMKLFEDSHANLWVGDLTSVYRLHGGEVSRFTAADGVPPKAQLRPWLEDSDGAIWFASGWPVGFAGGVVRFQNGKFKVWNKQSGLPGDLIDKLFKDHEGTIWVVPIDHGICRLQRQLVTSISTSDGLIHNEVYPVLQTRSGDIYAGTTRGVSRLPLNGGRFVDVLVNNPEGVIVSAASLWEDERGVVWVGGTNGDLFLVENGRSRRIKIGDQATTFTIQNDHAGNVWLGTDKGLVRVRNEQIIERFTTRDGLPSNDVKVIHLAKDGSLWLGTYGGLAQLRFSAEGEQGRKGEGEKGSGGESKTGSKGVGEKGSGGVRENARSDISPTPLLPHSPTSPSPSPSQTISPTPPLPHSPTPSLAQAVTVFTTRNGLASDRVRAIHEDESGTLWIGTYDGGLSRFREGHFFNYTINNGLFNNGVFAILEDDQNNFWISSNRGIYSVKRSELEAAAAGQLAKINTIAYGKQDGMLSTECNGGRQPAGFRARDGKLWFATQDGVVAVNVADVRLNPQPPPVQIEGILINHLPLDLQNEITLRANSDNLELRYTGISFIKPDQIKFRYRLVGLTDLWNDLGTKREVYFASLPAGEYTFQVIAANSGDVWNQTGAFLKIHVRGPFYQKTWFIAMCAVFGIGVAFVIFRLRERELQRRQVVQQEYSRRLLESQEDERKRIASEMHDSLGQYLLAIKNWALFGLNSTKPENPAREHLTEISDTSTLALEEVREIAHNLRPYQLERLGLTNTLDYMLRHLKHSAAFSLTAEIENIDGRLSPEAEINFYRIAQECVNNVIKHSQAAHMWLSVKPAGAGVELVCRDDGQGFAVDAVRNSSKSGLGLNGIAERVRILGGTHSVESVAGQGTTIHVRIEGRKAEGGKGRKGEWETGGRGDGE